MTFTTPHGTVRYRLPWSWSAFDYARCARAVGAVRRRALRDGEGRRPRAPSRPARSSCAPTAATSARRSSSTRSAGGACSRPRTTSRPTPRSAAASRSIRQHGPRSGGARSTSGSSATSSRRGYGWRVPAGDEARIGVGSYDPRDGACKAADASSSRSAWTPTPVRYQGNWFPHRLRAAVEDGVFFVGDSAGHCLPLSGEGIRTAFYFGVAAGRELRAVARRRAGTRATRCARYAAFHERHRPAFRVGPASPARSSRRCRRAR